MLEDDTGKRGLLYLLRQITRESIYSSTLSNFKEILGALKNFNLELIEQLWGLHTSQVERNFA